MFPPCLQQPIRPRDPHPRLTGCDSGGRDAKTCLASLNHHSSVERLHRAIVVMRDGKSVADGKTKDLENSTDDFIRSFFN